MLGHSSSDDPTKYRDQAEVDAWAARDPITRYERWLVEGGVLAEDERARVEQELLAEIDAVVHEQEAAAPMALRSLVEDVYAEVPRHLRRQYNDFIRVAERHGDAQPGDGAFPL
jgi:TPP-dependent pyruvate/acetoin dehydrogenase alpha subunit